MKRLTTSIIILIILSAFVGPAGAKFGGETLVKDSKPFKYNINLDSNIPLYSLKPLAPTSLKIVSLAAGENHACALVEGGGVKCWGDNEYGQLGDDTNTERSSPTAVSGLSSGVSTIAANSNHTCALMDTGAMKCWGSNHYGELGDDTTTHRKTPVNVSGLGSGVEAIAVGGTHTCAVVNGGAKCWGRNAYGQLGDSTNIISKTPVAVSGLGSGVTVITAGAAGHTCAVVNGGARCWGYNSFGQLGNASWTDSNIPVDVFGLGSGVVGVAAGANHTCAVVNGAAKCWGRNYYGQLGNATSTNSNIPTDVSGLNSGVTNLGLGNNHSCAVVNGAAKCWGHNWSGKLGDGNTTNQNVPVAVVGFSGEPEILAAGSDHTCARSKSGQVMCWGYNEYGQLGVGYSTKYSTPEPVSSLGSNATAVSAGGKHTCAVASGGIMCWGDNDEGQLGNNSTIDSSTPVVVSGLTSGVTAVAAGYEHSCALVSGGVQCWGNNIFGQLGDNTNVDSDEPVQVSGLTSGVKAITAAGYHTCAIVTDSANDIARCWGHNTYGQLGNGSNTNSNIPVNVSGITGGVIDLKAGSAGHTCAVVSGGAKCWGRNHEGQLGDTTTSHSNTPVDVSGLTSGVSDVGAGKYHSFAITTTVGGAKSWGENRSGQLGNNSTTDSETPVNVSGLGSGVSVLIGGDGHSCAVVSSGAKCWGNNEFGQVGDATGNESHTPQDVSGETSGVIDISAGDDHSCDVSSAGAVKCWGYNDHGQLGNGKGTYSTSPLAVSGADFMLPATITSLSPDTTAAGGPAFTLTVNGYDFVDGISTVRWNGSDRTTTYVSNTQLTASIGASDIAAGGTANITVFKSADADASSNAMTFTITNPLPSITNISPDSASAGGAAFTLTVNGANFIDGVSTVRWKGINRPTTFVSDTQLEASIGAADCANPGTAAITVVNCAPGGGVSNPITFTIDEPVGLNEITLPLVMKGK